MPNEFDSVSVLESDELDSVSTVAEDQSVARSPDNSVGREFIANLGRTAKQTSIGITQGFANLGAGANKLLELNERYGTGGAALRRIGSLLTGQTPVAEEYRGAAEIAREQAKLLEQTGQETEGPAFARKLGAGAVSIVPAIAAGPLGISAAIGASGLTSFADTFQSAEEVAIAGGATPEEARRKAAVPAVASGLATAAITALGGKVAPGVEGFAQGVATQGFRDAAKKIILNAGAEATEEGVDQVAQAAIAKVSYNPSMTWEQAFAEALEAAQIGGILGGTLSGVSMASAKPEVEVAKQSNLPVTAAVLNTAPPPIPTDVETVIQPEADAPIVEETVEVPTDKDSLTVAPVVQESLTTEEIPLGVNRPAVRNRELSSLADDDFRAQYDEAEKRVIELETAYDEGGTVDRPALAEAQDQLTALELEDYRREITDLSAEDLFFRLRQVAATAAQADTSEDARRAEIIVEELNRQGTTEEQLLQGLGNLTDDQAEVFRGKLEDIRTVAARMEAAALEQIAEVESARESHTADNYESIVYPEMGGVVQSVPPGTKVVHYGPKGESAAYRRTEEVDPKGRVIFRTNIGITDPRSAAVVKLAADTAQKWFTAEGNLPVEVFQENVGRVGKIKEQLTEARYAEQDLYKALRGEYEISRTERFMDGMAKVPKPVIRQMNAVLKGEADPSTLPESVREPIARMRAHIDALSAQMLDKGLIDSELATIVDDNLGTYLTRSYRVFDDPEFQAPIEVQNRARAFLLDGLRRTDASATPEDADRLMRSLMEDWRSKGVDKFLSQGRIGNKDLTLFMRRKDIAPEIRALMGEYETPVINYMNSVSRISRLIADQEFLNEVRRLGMGKFLFEDGTQPRGFDALIAAEDSATMSPLNGLRTTREIAEAFKEFGRVSKPEGVWKMLLAINAVAKGAKTIGSVMTQARNLTGQPFFWAMSGHWDWTPAADAIKAVSADIGTTDSRAWRDRYKEYVRLGIVDDSTQAQELKDAFKDGGLLNELNVDEFASKQLGNNLKKMLIGAPARAYQVSDELGKIVGFENEVVRQRSIHPTWSDAQVKQEAATRIRNTYPTYSMVPEAIRKWRRQPIFGPFVSFAYETFRTTYWNLRYMAEDLQTPNAAQNKAGAQRMAGIAGVMASGYALSVLTRALFGITRDEEDDLRQFLPPWAENSELLFTGKDDDGNLSYLNQSYLNPYSYLTDPFIAVATNLRDDEGIAKSVLEAAKEFMSPFINEQIATAAMIDVARNQTSTGKQVYNPQDPDKWKDMFEHVFASIEPGTSQRFRRRMLPAFQGEQTEFGRVLNPTAEVAREVTGLNTETTDFKQAIAFKASEFRKAEPETENIFRSLVTKRGKVDDAEIVEAYRKSEQTRFSLYQDFFDDIQAARRRGVSDREIYNAITSRGVGKDQARLLLRGVYKPYEVTPQMKARLRDLGRKLPVEEMATIQREYNGKTYKVQ